MINSKENRKSPAVVLVPMLLLSLFIQLVRLPAVVSENRPDLLILVILFFSMNSKFTYKLEVSWLVGIILDLASESSFQNSLSLLLKFSNTSISNSYK